MATTGSRTIKVRSPFWALYLATAVLLLLAGVGGVAARPSTWWGWGLVVVQLAAGASLLAQARAAYLAGVTVSDEGLSWLGRRGFVKYRAAWDDVAGFSLTNGPRVLPCVELQEHGPLPLIVYGMTATRSKALIDELEQERQARTGGGAAARATPKPKASPKRKNR